MLFAIQCLMARQSGGEAAVLDRPPSPTPTTPPPSKPQRYLRGGLPASALPSLTPTSCHDCNFVGATVWGAPHTVALTQLLTTQPACTLLPELHFCTAPPPSAPQLAGRRSSCHVRRFGGVGGSDAAFDHPNGLHPAAGARGCTGQPLLRRLARAEKL